MAPKVKKKEEAGEPALVMSQQVCPASRNSSLDSLFERVARMGEGMPTLQKLRVSSCGALILHLLTISHFSHNSHTSPVTCHLTSPLLSSHLAHVSQITQLAPHLSHLSPHLTSHLSHLTPSPHFAHSALILLMKERALARCKQEQKDYYMCVKVERCRLTTGPPRVDRAWCQRVKLEHDELLSSFAFNFNMGRYVKDRLVSVVWACTGQSRALNDCLHQYTTDEVLKAGAYTRPIFGSTYGPSEGHAGHFQ
jgi:hypothetical protein